MVNKCWHQHVYICSVYICKRTELTDYASKGVCTGIVWLDHQVEAMDDCEDTVWI